MNKTTLWNLIICINAAWICGCGQPQMLEIKKNSIDKNSIADYAGTWLCYYPIHFEVTFGKDGKLESMLHYTGWDFVIAEGGTSGLGPNNEVAMFVLGPCNVRSKGNNLDLTVSIDYYKMELPQGTLEGWIKDTLMGKLSEDKKTWTVKWYCYSKMEGAGEPNIREMTENPVDLVLHKFKPDPNTLPNQ
jgi:hypothetical protein